MTSYDPYDHASRLGIGVVEDEWALAPTEYGVWLPRFRTIYLRPGMSTTHERSVLAHEMGHVCLGHSRDDRKLERLADRFAAEHLLCLDEVIDAMRCSPDPARWAWDLQVTGRILHAFLRAHEADIAAAASRSHLARLAG